MPNKTIQLMKNIWTSSTRKLPRAYLFFFTKKTEISHRACFKICNPTSRDYFDKLKITTACSMNFPSQKINQEYFEKLKKLKLLFLKAYQLLDVRL